MNTLTQELTGAALDWAVAKAEGITCAPYRGKVVDQWGNPLVFHEDWSLAGPIIEREGMQIQTFMDKWLASIPRPFVQQDGPTPLIAAMRCYVASKLGDTVDIPEELA
jgi:hypothetical protein